MSPEEEAALRAQMAQARQTIDLDEPEVIDLDTPQPQPVQVAPQPEQHFDPQVWMYETGTDMGDKIAQKTLPADFKKREVPGWVKWMSARQQASVDHQNAVDAGKAQPSAAYRAMGYTPAGYVAQKFLGYKDQKMGEAIQSRQADEAREAQLRELDEREENVRRAIRNLKSSKFQEQEHTDREK